MANAVIIYPQFKQCQDYTLDQYWKDIFFACSCNKFPRGVRYDDSAGTLYVRTPSTGGKTKIKTIDLPKSPEKLYHALIQIFRERLGLYSSRDLQIRKEELCEIQEARRINMDCSWKELPRPTKDLLIMNYATKLKKKYQLTSKEAKHLLGTIQLGFQFKELNSEDVGFSNKEIKNIRGLEYLADERRWVITNSPKKTNKKEKALPTHKFYQLIDRFLRDYNTNRLNIG